MSTTPDAHSVALQAALDALGTSGRLYANPNGRYSFYAFLPFGGSNTIALVPNGSGGYTATTYTNSADFLAATGFYARRGVGETGFGAGVELWPFVDYWGPGTTVRAP